MSQEDIDRAIQLSLTEGLSKKDQDLKDAKQRHDEKAAMLKSEFEYNQ